jgi:hypothetical protein
MDVQEVLSISKRSKTQVAAIFKLVIACLALKPAQCEVIELATKKEKLCEMEVTSCKLSPVLLKNCDPCRQLHKISV